MRSSGWPPSCGASGADDRDRRPLGGGSRAASPIVVSALAGATDCLLGDRRSARSRASQGRPWNSSASLRARHLAVARAVAEPEDRVGELCEEIDDQFERLCAVVRSLAVLREVAPRSLDAVAALGEILSSRIVAAALAARGLPAEWIDPRGLIVTDNSFTTASPLMPRDVRARERDAGPFARGRARAGHRRVRGCHTPRASRRRSAAAGPTTRRRSSARASPPTRSRSGPTSTAC